MDVIPNIISWMYNLWIKKIMYNLASGNAYVLVKWEEIKEKVESNSYYFYMKQKLNCCKFVGMLLAFTAISCSESDGLQNNGMSDKKICFTAMLQKGWNGGEKTRGAVSESAALAQEQMVLEAEGHLDTLSIACYWNRQWRIEGGDNYPPLYTNPLRIKWCRWGREFRRECRLHQRFYYFFLVSWSASHQER